MLDDRDGLLWLLKQHLDWYPQMELRDVYKLLYQGVMGAEHLISSPEEFTRLFAIGIWAPVARFTRTLP